MRVGIDRSRISRSDRTGIDYTDMDQYFVFPEISFSGGVIDEIKRSVRSLSAAQFTNIRSLVVFVDVVVGFVSRSE